MTGNFNPVDSTQAFTSVSGCGVAPFVIHWKRVGTSVAPSMATSMTTSYTITGLQKASTYIAFAVDANNDTTPFVSFTTSGVPYCSPIPTNVMATSNCNTLDVTWSGSSAKYQPFLRRIIPAQTGGGGSYVATNSASYPIASYAGYEVEVSVYGMCYTQYTPASAPIYITVPPLLTAPVVNYTATCSTVTMTWAAIPCATSYQVYFKNMTTGVVSYISGITGTTYTKTGLLANQNYQFKVIARKSGMSLAPASPLVTVMTCVGPQRTAAPETEGVEEEIFTPELSIFPNPNVGSFTLQVNNWNSEEPAQLEVVNALGQCVHKQIIESQEASFEQAITLPALSSGIYRVILRSNDNSYTTSFVRD
jgi:hypothetical protein